MRINTNLNAMVATNQMAKNTALSGASMEKLSTGLRITKAGDDATGLAISEKMRAQIRGMEQADRNVQDGISMVQTAEGAMEEIGNITQRMRELTVQASNETNTAEDRTKITEELTQLNEEITRIAESTTFNNEKILVGGRGFDVADLGANAASISDLKITSNLSGVKKVEFTANSATEEVTVKVYADDAKNELLGEQTLTGIPKNHNGELNFDDLGIKFNVDATGNKIEGILKDKEVSLKDGFGDKNISIQAGANNESSNTLSVNIGAMTSESLGINADDINAIGVAGTVGTKAANDFLDKLDEAISKVNTSRSKLGAQQNRLEYTSSNLVSSTENLTSAESRIRDVDVAKEMVTLSKLNILNQASQAMVSQAKQQPESVSQLLR
ncbi:flagellin N-terminal helical domain-containing protein [Romboutsia timonensis]|uniref:flagellin N-terminal helical domain-containing protein n=1 Tax=Romboutsia timonensis TaxID=1776391 RepID=UPI0008D9E773|nr:flagellin [Romboutsia timonensis]